MGRGNFKPEYYKSVVRPYRLSRSLYHELLAQFVEIGGPELLGTIDKIHDAAKKRGLGRELHIRLPNAPQPPRTVSYQYDSTYTAWTQNYQNKTVPRSITKFNVEPQYERTPKGLRATNRSKVESTHPWWTTFEAALEWYDGWNVYLSALIQQFEELFELCVIYSDALNLPKPTRWPSVPALTLAQRTALDALLERTGKPAPPPLELPARSPERDAAIKARLLSILND